MTEIENLMPQTGELMAEVQRLREIIKRAEDVQVEYNDFEAAIMGIQRILEEANHD